MTSHSKIHHGLLSPDFQIATPSPGCEMMVSGGMTKMFPWEQQLIRRSMGT